MNISVFSFLNITEYENIGFKVANFRGLFHRNHLLCIAYAISVIGLAGFPITSGFVAKIFLFSAIVNSGLVFIPFLLALLILMVVALFYYLKLILPLFEKTGYDPKILNTLYSQKFVLFITTAITLLLGIYPEKIIELCKFVAYNV
jgi:NADH-quinone oxidoreductase subunit N